MKGAIRSQAKMEVQTMIILNKEYKLFRFYTASQLFWKGCLLMDFYHGQLNV